MNQCLDIQTEFKLDGFIRRIMSPLFFYDNIRILKKRCNQSQNDDWEV